MFKKRKRKTKFLRSVKSAQGIKRKVSCGSLSGKVAGNRVKCHRGKTLIERKTFNIAVVATMSAGKSTLLNALVGTSLLPTAHQACTSKIFFIEDVDGQKAPLGRIEKGGKFSRWRKVDSEVLSAWNDSGASEIQIRKDVVGVPNLESGLRLCLVDTPGPNNSLDISHTELTKRLLKGADFCQMLVVLDATSLATNDEHSLLKSVLEEANTRKIHPFFILNKIDLLKFSKEENPAVALAGINRYLSEMGFDSPTILPISAQVALTVREWMLAPKRVLKISSESDGYLNAAYVRKLSKWKFECEAAQVSGTGNKTSIRFSPAFNRVRTVKLGEVVLTAEQLFDAQIASGLPLLEYLISREMKKFLES